jgi:hypothetical protein
MIELLNEKLKGRIIEGLLEFRYLYRCHPRAGPGDLSGKYSGLLGKNKIIVKKYS